MIYLYHGSAKCEKLAMHATKIWLVICIATEISTVIHNGIIQMKLAIAIAGVPTSSFP